MALVAETQIDAVNRRGQRELVVSSEQRSRKRHQGDGQEKGERDPKVHAVGADDKVQLHVGGRTRRRRGRRS